MKFRVSVKDFIIFVVFCVFLLYISALLVLNFASFAGTGLFYGLNPIKAFSSQYLVITIVVFAIFLILIFTSVSSYIFDKDKGKGLGLKLGEKEEKGYSRWATEKEIKASKDIERVIIQEESSTAAGVPLINNGKEMWVDNGENHTMVIGATASGKTTCVVDPMVYSLVKKGESMVITDPKGELYKNHAGLLREKGYKVIVLNFRDQKMGSAWNPLTLPYQLYKEGNVDKATELLDDIALNILTDQKTQGDPFWQNNASDYFSGIALGLFEDAKDESEVNLNSIGYMATAGEEKFAASQYIKEYFNLKGEDSSAYTFASSVINAPSETKGGVVSVFRQKIRLFTSKEDLSEMLSHSDFDMRKIGHEKTAIFLVIHDEKTTYHALATIFVKQCYETLIASAYEEANGKLPYKTNFILDEFANMPPLRDVTAMVTAARSRAIRFIFIIQNFAQLDAVYGKENAQTIRSNCGNLLYLITTELAALEEISKLCGEIKSKDKEKTASVPLITVADLQKLKLFEVIIIRTRTNPFKTKLTPSFNINWGKIYPKSEFYSREIVKYNLFDIKEFVKEKKRTKLFEALEQSNNGRELTPSETPTMAPGLGSTSTSNNKPKFNFDELAKKIDAKIAAIEAEEKAKKNNMPPVNNQNQTFNIYNEEKALPKESEPANIKPDNLEKNIELKESMFKPEEDMPVTKPPKVNVDQDSVIVSENNITDDQFFDDFFQDDE